MKKIVISFLVLFCLTIKLNKIYAQCDTVANACYKNITAKYISDGQQYRALLLTKEVAEFNATLFGGTQYRMAACSGMTDGNLVFSIFDKQHNMLFTNTEHKNAPYWDFKIKNTLDCTIEAQLLNQNAASGCAVLLIGFKQ
jgi:hypothetical protein